MNISAEIPILSILLRVGAAILILLVGRRLAHFSRHWLRDTLEKTEMTASLVTLFTIIAYYMVILLAVILALAVLGVPIGSIIAILGIILIILGIAMQESLSNFAATILFLLFQPFKVGDLIETASTLGTVKEIQLFHSVIVTFQNKTVTLPNNKIQESITNYSRIGVLRADVVISVSYSEDLRQVKQLLEEMLAEDNRVLPDPAATVAILDFEDSGIKIGVRPFVNVADYWDIQFDLRERIKARFDETGITIPFPQRDVHMVSAAT